MVVEVPVASGNLGQRGVERGFVDVVHQLQISRFVFFLRLLPSKGYLFLKNSNKSKYLVVEVFVA